MKVQTLFLISAVTLSFIGCKKNKEEAKDIKTLFSNTTWTGEAKYTSRPIAEPFRVKFDAAGTFTWYEFNGEYPGTFFINEDKKTVAILFGGGTTFTGTVAEDNKLINLKYGATYPWTIISMELNNTTESELTGTIWSGNYVGTIGPGSLTLTFQPSSMLLFNGTNNGVTNYIVSYQFKDGTIRFSPPPVAQPFFGIVNKGKITGIQTASGGSYHKWQVTKQ